MTKLSEFLPPRNRLIRGLWIATLLWMLFLSLTAYMSVSTLFHRIASDDVMKAASGSTWGSVVVWQVAGFVVTQFALHLFFAGLTWVLACAGAIVSEPLRPKFGRLVIGWFSVVTAGVLAYAAYWYPRTLIGAYYHDAMAMAVGPLQLGPCVYWGALAACLLVLARAAVVLVRRGAIALQRGALIASGAALSLAVVVAIGPLGSRNVAAAARSGQPNIIVLGIDSLRLEQLQRFGGTGITPNLDRFLATADIFPDATTPVARTFPSWTAILTGRAPTLNGARFNLADPSTLHLSPTVGDLLRKAGYHTVYSTDEVRFANIDERYGFDEVVTPRIGASDFVVGTYNELPLAALFINTRVGHWLFPFSWANRGVATMFQPRTYLDRIRDEVTFDRPTFLIAHLTAAHWPYYTSQDVLKAPEPTDANPMPKYRIGLQTADRMFGELVSILERKGALNNALVIVLSDHGEALSLPSDSFFDSTFHVEGLRAPLRMSDYGHGQSVLSKSQYHVLLSFRTFGTPRKLGDDARVFPYPVTVEDIAPTILEFAGVAGDPLKTTGQSLLSMLDAGQVDADAARNRIRYTETDLAVLPAPNGGVDEDATARQNAMFFEIDPHTGRMHIRALYAPLASTYKERAAFTRSTLLAAIPAGPESQQYIYFDFARNHGQLLLQRPGDDMADAQRLWDAMSDHFGAEMKAPVAVTREDLPRFDEEWGRFIYEQQRRKDVAGARAPG